MIKTILYKQLITKWYYGDLQLWWRHMSFKDSYIIGYSIIFPKVYPCQQQRNNQRFTILSLCAKNRPVTGGFPYSVSTDTNTGDPLHSRAACTQPCNVNTHSRAHCSPGARLCEQWGHGCVNNGARLCASARLCRGSPVTKWSNIYLT